MTAEDVDGVGGGAGKAVADGVQGFGVTSAKSRAGRPETAHATRRAVAGREARLPGRKKSGEAEDPSGGSAEGGTGDAAAAPVREDGVAGLVEITPRGRESGEAEQLAKKDRVMDVRRVI